VKQEDLAALGEYLFVYLRDVMNSPAKACLDLKRLPREFERFGRGLQFFAECVTETASLAKSLSKGNIKEVELPSRQNEIAAPLKSLHSSLVHLTWQTQQVAQGDYEQHVSFMGEFAEAFNSMIFQLNEHRNALLDEIESGHKKTLALERSNTLLESLMSSMPQLIVVTDKETGYWLFLNHPIETVITREAFIPQIRQWLTSQFEKLAGSIPSSTSEIELRQGDAVQCFSVACYPLLWYGHNAVVFVMTDISGEKEQLRALEDYAYRDHLTKVYNRYYGMKILNEWLDERRSFVLCFVDIDYLKYVNDLFGHNAGDDYILYVAEAMKKLSGNTLLCRLGGDEFMLLQPDWDVSTAAMRLEEMRSLMKSKKAAANALYSYSISFGVVAVDEKNTLPAADLLSIADEKMYKDKRVRKASRSGDTPKPKPRDHDRDPDPFALKAE
jgi:diguanylate cyclase (GGDEF)-like protein